MIFKEPWILFIFSNVLSILCLLIQRELLVEVQWILRSTLILSLFIIILSLFLLLRILKIVFVIVKYQK